MTEQEAFEEWLGEKHKLTAKWNEDRNCYEVFSAHLAWKSWQACAERKDAEIKALRDELEDERIRLSACGVVAQANTPESAAEQRQMSDRYKSASLECVIDTVDREMQYRAELEALRGFANAMYNSYLFGRTDIEKILKKHRLIDATGQPTALLTGESE